MELPPADTTVMRAIAARERKRALVNRREAQKAHAAARGADASVANSTGWSTKAPAARPGQRKRAGSAAIETPAAEARAAWAKRHPQAAKTERGFRKARAEMLGRWAHKNDGTPETHEQASRRNQGALVQLYRNAVIDADQLASAVEIAEVAERIGADVAVRTASLEARVDEGWPGDGSFFEKLGQVRREVAYTRWRATLVEKGAPIAAVLEMLVGQFSADGPVGFTVVAKRYRMHNRRAKRLLIDALDLWPRILGRVAKEIDPAALAAAQAGILG